MPDTTDIAAVISLKLISDISAQLARDGAAFEAFNVKVASAPTNIGSVGAMQAIEAENSKLTTSSVELAARREAAIQAAYEKETAAAIKSGDVRVAQSERVTLAVIRDADRQTAAAKAAAEKQAAIWSKVGTGVGIAGLAVVAFGAKSVVSLDSAEKKVQAFTNAIGNTRNQIPLDELRAKIQALSDETGIMASTLTAGFYNIASSNLSAQKSLEILTQSTRYAKASQTDAGVSMKLLTSITNAYGLSLPQIRQAQDDLTQATKQGTFEASELAPALAGIIPVAAHLGIGLKDLGSWFTVLTNDGISAAESGVYLGNMLNHLLAPTQQQIKTVVALNGSYDDLVVHHGNVTATLKRLNDLVTSAVPNLKSLENGTGSMSARAERFAQQIEHADGRVRQLFGGNMEAAKAFFALMANGGSQTDAALKGMQNDAGATDKAYKIAMTSMANQFDLVKQKADEMGRQMAGPFVSDALTGAHAIGALNDMTHGGVADMVKYGVEAGAAAFLILKIRGAWIAVKGAAEAARVAEIAAFAASPAGIAVAITAFASYEAHQKTVNDNLDAMKSAEARLTTEYDKGNISADQARKILAAFAAVAKVGTGDVVDLTMAKLNDSKVKYQDHIKLEADALHHLGTELTDSVGYWNSLTDAKKKYYQFDGKGAAALSPGASDPKSASKTPLEDAIAKVDKAIPLMAEKIVADSAAYGKHSSQVEDDTRKLDALKAQSVELHKQWDSLTTTSKALKTAGLDPFTKGFQDAQKRLSDATAVIAQDYVKGLPVSAAQRQAFDDATASVKRYQAAQDAADGTAAKRAADREAKQDKAEEALRKKHEALALAAERAAQALLKVQRSAIEQSPVYQAEVARYNATVHPSPQTGGLDPITIIENKIVDLWNSPKSYQQIEDATIALGKQLDAAIKKYGDGVQKQFDKAEKDLENNPNIPGTDAWVKKLEAEWKKVAASPAVIAGLANLRGASGLAIGGTFGGQTAASNAAATNFGNQVNLGVLGAANSAQAQQVALQVAKQIGDVGTQFSILSKLYAEGKVSLSALIPVERENAALLTQQNQRLIINDIAMGDMAGAATLAKQAYLDGTMSLDQYVKIQQAANTVAAQQAGLQAKADIALGDFAGAAAIAKTAFDSGSMSMDEYVPILQQANAGTAAMASRTLEAAYAAGTLAEKSQMVVSAMSAIVSRASTIQGAQSGVDQANIAVIAAQSAVAVGYLQAQVTATTDLAGIVSASSAVQTAVFNGQLAAINDGTTIMNDLYGIQSATSPQALQVARDQLAVDQMIARMNQANAAAQIRVTSDTAKMAMDKLSVDNANSNANATVAALHLKVSQDAVKLAVDNQRLQIAQLVTLQDIDANLGGDPQAQAIQDAVTQLGIDTKQSTADQFAEAIAAAQAAQIAGQGNLLLAGDQGQINSDQANAASISQGFELSIAGLKQQQAADNIKLQESSAKTAANTTQLVEMQRGVKEILDEIRSLNDRGLQGMERNNVSTDSTAALLGRMGSQISANPTPA